MVEPGEDRRAWASTARRSIALRADEADARDRSQRLDALLTGDPLVALARALPPTHDAVAGADASRAAGGALLDAADAGLALADRYRRRSRSSRRRPPRPMGDRGAPCRSWWS